MLFHGEDIFPPFIDFSLVIFHRTVLFKKKIIYLFIFGCAGSSLPHGLSLVVASTAYCVVVVCGLLIAVASLVVEHRLWGAWASAVAMYGLSSCGSRSYS